MSMDRRRFLIDSAAAIASLSLWGCRDASDGSTGHGAASSRAPEIVVFRNGTVLPVDEAFSEGTALAIQGNRILAVGTEEAVLSAAGTGARLVDLGGRTILPGFIEPHMHFTLVAGLGFVEDIGPFQQPTFDAALAALRRIHEDAVSAGPDAWVLGRQFDPVLLDPPRDLTLRELDEIAPDRPAFVLNASGHVAYANSRALAAGGIAKDAPDPPGAEFGRWEDGTLNGVLYGQAAYFPVLMANEAIATRMETGFVEAGIEVGDQAAPLGITTLCDQAAGAYSGPTELEGYRQMYESGRMKARIRAYLFDSMAEAWDASGVRYGDGDALMRVAGWKTVTDGSNQGFTGRQREPYYTRDSRGIYYVQPEDLRELVLARARAGWPMSMHGNGDAAIDSILDASEYAASQGVDVRALRFRIEHASILHDDQIARMSALGIAPSFLINHVHYWGHVMRDQVFGPEKVQLLDRCAAAEAAGLNWVIHTDAPVSPLGSLHKIRVAVARDLWKEPETILAPQERVPVEAAIRSVTRNAAWLCHSEHEIGSLEPDKLADFVILEEDPRKVDPVKISDITISETWMDGKKVYES
jgi:predicted amidohydrolase YtcJ